MLIKVYGDESGTHDKTGKQKGSEVPVVGGYFAPPEFWDNFNKQWQAVLDDPKYKAPYFHAKELEFHYRQRESKKPFYKWSDEKVADFKYDLAMVAGNGAIPIGGMAFAAGISQKGLNIDPFELAFTLFFNDLCEALNARKLFNVDRFSFVFDSHENESWRDYAHNVHAVFRKNNPNFGGISFEDDKDPLHCGLQAADLYASSIRRPAVPHMQSGGKLQPRRTIDLILMRHMREEGHSWNLSGIPDLVFRLMIGLFREDERRMRAQWKKQGIKGREYHPEFDFPFEQYGIPKPPEKETQNNN